MADIASIIRDATVIMAAIGSLIAVIGIMLRIIDGVKCLLRHNMMHTYYRRRETKQIRQYEMEDFEAEYKAYKALRGNSFVDKIRGEVMRWEVIS